MAELLTERAFLGVIATLAVLGLFVMLCRARRVTTSVEDAVMAVLQRMSKAASDLREGLTQDAADKAVPHLRELLKCIAVGITDRLIQNRVENGTLLAVHDGVYRLRGVPYTQEGMAVRGNRLFLLPEDGSSRLFEFQLER